MLGLTVSARVAVTGAARTNKLAEHQMLGGEDRRVGRVCKKWLYEVRWIDF